MAALLHRDLVANGYLEKEETYSAIKDEALLSTASLDVPPDPFYASGTVSFYKINTIAFIFTILLH